MAYESARTRPRNQPAQDSARPRSHRGGARRPSERRPAIGIERLGREARRIVLGSRLLPAALRELSPREIEHDNPEIKRTDEMARFLGQLYNRPVGEDETVTVIRFSQIIGTMF